LPCESNHCFPPLGIPRDSLFRENALEKRQSSEQFSAELTALYRLIFEAANKSRDLQNKVLALAEDLLSKRNDQAALKESIDKFNGAKDAYNQSQGDLLKRVNDLYLKAQSM